MPAISQRLRKLPEAAVSSLLRRFLIDPFSDRPEPYLDDLTDDELAVVDAVRGVAKFDPDDLRTSAEARARTTSLLTSVLTSRVIDTQRGREARERLGARGALPPRSYRLVGWRKQIETNFGPTMTRGEVTRALETAERVQHMPINSADRETADSLFLSTVAAREGRSYYMLVHCARRADRLVVHGAWRVPKPIVERAAPGEVVDVLQDFAHAFGLTLWVGNQPPTKFLREATIPWDTSAGRSGGDVDISNMIRHEDPGTHRWVLLHSGRVSQHVDAVQVQNTYMIDLTRYWADRRLFPAR